MQPIVARGRKPAVYACGMCHRESGSCGPESASLAGLPAKYIVQQLADFKSGARKSAVPKRNVDLMVSLSVPITPDEVQAAAAYFSSLKPQPNIKVVEARTAPKTGVTGMFLAAVKTGEKEPIGHRIIEVPENLERFENLALYALRFAWVYCLRGVASLLAVKHGLENAAPGFRTLALTTVGGVRGAVTLAGVLSQPVTLDDGTPLAGRELAIFIASAVILASLLIAVVGLPILLRGTERLRNPHAAEERMARRLAAQAAIRAIDDTHDELVEQMDESASARCADSTARVMGVYRRRLDDQLDENEAPRVAAKKIEAVETRLKMAALRAERPELLRLSSLQTINDETLNKLMREVDLAETAVVNRKRGIGAN